VDASAVAIACQGEIVCFFLPDCNPGSGVLGGGDFLKQVRIVSENQSLK